MLLQVKIYVGHMLLQLVNNYTELMELRNALRKARMLGLILQWNAHFLEAVLDINFI